MRSVVDLWTRQGGVVTIQDDLAGAPRITLELGERWYSLTFNEWRGTGWISANTTCLPVE